PRLALGSRSGRGRAAIPAVRPHPGAQCRRCAPPDAHTGGDSDALPARGAPGARPASPSGGRAPHPTPERSRLVSRAPTKPPAVAVIRLAERLRCPTCLALPYGPCQDLGGRPLWRLHRARIVAAIAALR